MPVDIGEVTADVMPPESAPTAASAPEPQLSPPAELRRLREQWARLEQRAARVKAD